ncbi:MAG: NAD(P)/FAD-dependent oxidoreductase [Oscillospiraceae bacterium]
MIRIQNLTLPPEGSQTQLKQKAAKLLGVSPDSFTAFSLVRQSIDARKKSEVKLVCTVDISHPAEQALKLPKNAVRFTPEPYVFPLVRRRSMKRPVVVGMGPAGLFCALLLARSGVPCLILERGQRVERRTRDVETFWSGGALDSESNVQFGEGGAGTFSDGKLTTGIHDPRVSAVLDILAAAGAPEDIRWQHKPHIGTDILRRVVTNIRQELLSLGCEIRFGHRLTGLTVRGGVLAGFTAIGPEGVYDEACDTLVLAPGHSARDTFEMLRDTGIPLAPKPFAIGVRIEHPQAMISQAQYGSAWKALPPADYKLACHLPDGRSAFTFCVCPGGQVVAAASEPGRLVTNGMSCRARDGENINGGFLVGVSPADYGCTDPSRDPLLGVAFQREWEERAFRLGGGNYHAPAQTVAAFLGGPEPASPVCPTYRPGVRTAPLDGCLPAFVTGTLRAALPIFGHKLKGFDHPSALLTGVETRSSSPVRILRGENFQSIGLPGLYPCGEGAGYAGGITSAAVDGIRVAEAVAEQ